MLGAANRMLILKVGFHLAAAVALLVAAALYYSLAVQPLAASRKEKLAQVDRLERMQHAAANARRTRAELRQSLQALQERGAAMQRRIPKAADEHEFLRHLTHVSQAAGLEIADYRRQGVTERETHSELRIGLKCRGSHRALCRVLFELQAQGRILSVEKMTVSSDLATDRHAIELTIVLFYGLRAEAAAGGPNA